MLCSYCNKNPVMARGWCQACYYRQRRTGTLEYKPKRLPQLCNYLTCDKIAVSKGLCDTHRKRIDRHGDIYAGRPDWWGDKERRKTLGKNRKLKSMYGISLEDKNSMELGQKGVCAICAVPNRDRHGAPKSLHVDHCHTTGKVRGLLCDGCNRGLGYFSDTPDRLRAAATYLEKSSL